MEALDLYDNGIMAMKSCGRSDKHDSHEAPKCGANGRLGVVKQGVGWEA